MLSSNLNNLANELRVLYFSKEKKYLNSMCITLDYFSLLHDLLSGVAWVTAEADLHPSVDRQMGKPFKQR